MLADCDRCELRDIACPECVITVLPDGQAGLGEAERRALRVLAEAGLVPPLRFTTTPAPTSIPTPTPRSTPTSSSTPTSTPTPTPEPVPAARAATTSRRPPRSPRARHMRDTSPTGPTRRRPEGVKTGPRVAESVETAFALH